MSYETYEAAPGGGPILIARLVPRMSVAVIVSGRRLAPKTILAGSSSRAHDENRVMSRSAVAWPPASGPTRSSKGTSSAR